MNKKVDGYRVIDIEDDRYGYSHAVEEIGGCLARTIACFTNVEDAEAFVFYKEIGLAETEILIGGEE